MDKLKMQNSEIEMDVLQTAIENGIIDYKEIVVAIDDMKRKEILVQHPYSIWQNNDGKKQVRRRNSQQELENFLVEHYRQLEATFYIKDIFELWVEEKLKFGEIAALRKEDVGNHCIHVCRTECKFKGEDGKWTVAVKDFPKTEAGCRDILLPSTAEWTIGKILEINPYGEYLFMNNGKRIRENTFNKRLGDICDKLNIPHRSTHKVWKTYGTTLLDNNVDDSFVAEQMGHTDVTTTRKLYYYSNKNQKKKLAQIENAVSF